MTQNDIDKVQIYKFMNSNTILTDIIRHVIMRYFKTSDPLYPIWCVGSKHHVISQIQTHSFKIVQCITILMDSCVKGLP